LLGLAALVLAATLAGWAGHGYARWITVPVTLALAVAGGWRRRAARGTGGYLALLGGFGLLASLPALATVLRCASFCTQNDAFIYLTQAQWLQSHGFRQPVAERALHPALGMVWLFQQAGLRMGSTFLLGWLQSLLGLKWSVDIYPATLALGLVCGAMAVGAVVLTVCPQRRTEAWLAALTAALTLNGFAYGPLAGFLPQTYGLAFAAGAFALRGLEIAGRRRGGDVDPAGGWLGTLPLALCLAAAVLSYSEITPFLAAGTALSYLFPWPKAGDRPGVREQFIARGKQAGKLAALTMLLTNLEWARIPTAIAFQLHVVPGGPVDWRWWEFPAHALGLRSGVGDGVPWYWMSVGMGMLPALAVVALYVGGVQMRSRRGRAWRPRWAALWPVMGFALLFVPAFVFFRYVAHSPWPDRPGLRHLVGQTFYQIRLGHWSSLSLLACLLVGIIALGRLGGRPGRGAAIALLCLWCACGLAANYQLGLHRADPDLWAVGQRRDAFMPYQALRESLSAIPRTAVIYLDMMKPEAYVERQMVAYYLQDRRLVSDWAGDSYISAWLPRDAPAPGRDQCDWIVSRSATINAPHPPGYLMISAPFAHSLVMVRVDGPYGSETNGHDVAWWTGSRLHFEYQLEGSAPHHVQLSFTYHPAAADSRLNVRLKGDEMNQAFEIPMLPGDHPYISAPFEWHGDYLDVDFFCAQPPVHGPPADPRLFSYQIIDLSLAPMD
jgi:hypothetical protein